MSCYFEKQNAIRKDPLEVISGFLGFGTELVAVMAIGALIISASIDKPVPSYEQATQVVQDVLIPGSDTAAENKEIRGS